MKHLLFLTLFFVLTSCAVAPTTDQKNPSSMNKVSIDQEARLGRILYDQALQQLQETQPEAYVLYEQAHTAEVAGELKSAIELYHKAMQQAPKNGFLLTSLGMAYLRNEDTIPARRYLLKAISYDPGYYKPKLGLGYIYLQDQKFQKAMIQLEASLRLLPTVEGTFLLAEAKKARGNLPEARQLYQLVKQTDTNGKLGKAAATRLRSLPK
ncbi:MAG: hypothetical protein QM483_02605 [Desulfuromusa sp.]